ncbi:MAG: DUF935 family protein [Bacteroidales bacterium]|nr:DUF935 family protein [Bacteroidales bacterium]
MAQILDKFGREYKRPVALAGSKRENPSSIIAKIADAFKDRSRKDIDRWRSALQLAESKEKPRRDLLYAIYDDLRTDGHLENQIDMRKSAVLNTEFQIKSRSTGEVDEEKTRLIRTSWFYKILEILSETPIFGHSLIEFQSIGDGKAIAELMPRSNVVPVKKYVIPDFQDAETVIEYDTTDESSWLFEFGEADDLGKLNKVIPNLIWKRNMLQSWAEFAERFGIPMVTATTQRLDDDALDLVERMLEQLGEAAQAVFPEGTTVDIKEANRTDASEVFDKKIDRNNSEVSKAITGSTMLTDNGSSRSQSEVHERNLEERIAPMDRRNITFCINDKVLPILARNGMPFTDDDEFSYDTTQELGLDEHWKITEAILEKYEVDETWLSKTFNVPITGKKETTPADGSNIKKPQLKQVAVIGGAGLGLPTAMLEDLASNGVNFPTYDGEPCCAAHDAFIPEAAYNSYIDQLHEELFENYWNKKSTLSQEARIIAVEGLRLLSALRSGWGERAISVAYNEPDLLALSLMEYNLFEFSASKTEARLASLSQLLIDKDKLQIKSFADFKREAFKITNSMNTNWLRTEYNTSVAVGQNGSAFYKALSEKDSIPYVQYLTVGDGNVRSSHQILDKRIFNIKDVEAQAVWPPNDYGCRCSMVQYPHIPSKETVTKGKEAVKLLGGDQFTNSAFGINRGDTKQVFTNKQFYHTIKGLPDKIAKMNHKDTYGLADYKSFKNTLKPIKLDDTITADNANELFRIDGKVGNTEFMGFSDYLKRKLIVKKQTFTTHTEGKYIKATENRHKMFPHIQSVLDAPDEVWLQNYKANKFQSRYLKFYGDMAFVVDAELKGESLEIKTWYQMRRSEKYIRNGLLIK